MTQLLPMRWIFIPLNIAVILSTPSDGGHYLSDVLGGIAVAAAIVIAQRLFPRGAA